MTPPNTDDTPDEKEYTVYFDVPMHVHDGYGPGPRDPNPVVVMAESEEAAKESAQRIARGEGSISRVICEGDDQ